MWWPVLRLTRIITWESAQSQIRWQCHGFVRALKVNFLYFLIASHRHTTTTMNHRFADCNVCTRGIYDRIDLVFVARVASTAVLDRVHVALIVNPPVCMERESQFPYRYNRATPPVAYYY